MVRLTEIDLRTLSAIDTLTRRSEPPTAKVVTSFLKANGERHLRVGGVHMRVLRLRDKNLAALERVRGGRCRAAVITALGLKALKEFHETRYKGKVAT